MPDEDCIPRPMEGKCSPRSTEGAIGKLAGEQHGVVGRWQLARLGITRDAIEGRIGREMLHPIHRGVYAFGHQALTKESRWMAAVLAAGPGAVLSHRSAGQFWSLVASWSGEVEVTRPRKFRQRDGIRAHRAVLPADETVVAGGIPVTSPFRTLLDLAGTVTKRQLERAMHEAEVRQLTDLLSLPELLDRHPRQRGVANLRALLQAKEPAGRTENDFEEGFVAFLDEYGLPRPQLNATLALRGRFLKPDCLWREQRLIVELDGRAVHATDRAFENDRQRDRVLLAEGWRSTRVTWRQLRDEPAAIAADLREALERPNGSTL